MKTELQITNGPIGRNLLRFTIPIVLTGLLQLFYNMADVIVVGRYAGEESLAAVGSTTSLTTLFTNLFIGMSAGASVCVAQYIGAQNQKALSKAIHTAIGVALAGGVLIGLAGILLSRQMLVLMDSPPNVLEEAALYMKIIFLGMPANLVYNFGAGILRASGDAKHPLIFLSLSGIVNVILNLVLVIGFHRGADGVGIATVASQVLSAGMILYFLAKKNPVCKLYVRKIRIHFKYFIKILRIGIPAGIQGTVFSISNVLIQSSVNSFGSVVVAGNAAGANIGNLAFTAMNAVHQAMITFVGQNVGAGQLKRIKRIIGAGCLQVTVIGVVCSSVMLLFGKPLLSLYAPGNEPVIHYGMIRLMYILPLYFAAGIMDCLVGAQRGMGTSLVPMCASILGVCGFRIFWIFTVFASVRTLEILYLSYPVSWVLTAAVQGILCYFVYRNLRKKDQSV